MRALCDCVTPNECEAEALSGVTVTDDASATFAAEAILSRGVRHACIVTLGEQGRLWSDGATTLYLPAVTCGPLVETTWARDAFNGGFAAALAEGAELRDALRFATATTAPSMPDRSEIDAVLAGH